MRRLILALALLSVAACKKDDPDPQPAAALGFRQPSCDDPAGEGVFEGYNEAESKWLIAPKFQDTTAAMDPTAVSAISITSRNASGKDQGRAYFVYTPHRPLRVFFGMAYNDQRLQADIADNTDSNQVKSVDLFNLLWPYDFPGQERKAATPGCYRLYYSFGEPYGDPAAPKYRLVGKGHFDVNVSL